jgi:hypothetical protein
VVGTDRLVLPDLSINPIPSCHARSLPSPIHNSNATQSIIQANYLLSVKSHSTPLHNLPLTNQKTPPLKIKNESHHAHGRPTPHPLHLLPCPRTGTNSRATPIRTPANYTKGSQGGLGQANSTCGGCCYVVCSTTLQFSS